MTNNSITRTRVLLSLQRALLGEVFPALRKVTADWSDSAVKFWAYVDGELAPQDEESLSCVSAEVAADFSPGVEIDYEIIRCDAPQRIQDGRLAVFCRREAGS
jgi:hypothetical protein